MEINNSSRDINYTTNQRTKLLMLIILLVALAIPQTVWAGTPETPTVTSLPSLEQAIGNSFADRQTQFSINYVADTGNLSSEMEAILNNLLSADDYLKYSLKGWSYGWAGYVGDVVITFNVEYWESKDELDYVNSEVQNILAQIITPGMNDHQKHKAIHDYIVLHVAYDETKKEHSAYSALANGTAVCQGYTLLTHKMLLGVGIENRIVEGTVHGEGHTWNLVKLDGHWYHLDTTWDDPVPDVSGRVLYNYYNLTDAEMAADHTWTASYPQTDTTYFEELKQHSTYEGSADSYRDLMEALELIYLLPEYTAADVQELEAKLEETVSQKQNEITIRYLKGATIKDDSTAAYQKLAAKYHLTVGMSYSYREYKPGAIEGDLLVTYNFPFTHAAVPTISDQPQDASVSMGNEANLSLSATVETGNITYQWYRTLSDSTTSGSIIAGATQNTYSIPTTSPGTNYYYCVVTNTDTEVTGRTTAAAISRVAKVMVNFVPSHAVIYDGNRNTSGTILAENLTYPEGAKVPVAANTGNLAKEGFVFGGWNSHPRGLGTNYTTGSTLIMGTNDVTLYAKWTMDECFIATAAYGTKFSPAVVLLRKFRDEHLLTNKVGKEFVNFYYETSPPIARFIASNEVLKAVVRATLIPFILMAYLVMNPALSTMAIIILLTAGLVVYRKRMKKWSFKGDGVL